MDGYNYQSLPNDGITEVKVTVNYYGIDEVDTLDSYVSFKATLWL